MWHFRKRGNRRGQMATKRAVLPQVEALERRDLFSFYAELGATPGQYKNGGVELFSLNTTGSVLPSAETFHAGDGNSFSVPSGSLPTTKPGVVTWSHTYTTTPTSAPTATVTPTGGSAITVPLTLDSSFNSAQTGNTQGTLIADPVGSNTSDNNSGVASVVDPLTGHVYVLSAFDETSTSSGFAVTDYNPDGTVDSANFGNHTPLTGTSYFYFDSGKDVPTAISLSSGCIMVAGNSSLNGWAVAELSEGSGVPTPAFGSNGLETNFHTVGTCTSVIMETDPNNNEKVVVAGWKTVSGSPEMDVVRLTSAGAVDSTTFGPAPSHTGGETVINNFPSTIGSQALTLVQEPVLESFSPYDIIVAGYSSYCCGGCTACDMALAALDTSGGLDTSFGSNGNGTSTVNFGCSAMSCAIGGCSGSGKHSQDLAYSILPWEDTGGTGSPWYFYTIGESNFTGNDLFGIARFTASGHINTTWGYNGLTAIMSGPAGSNIADEAYAAVLQGGTQSGGMLTLNADQDPNVKIVLAGSQQPGTATNDFIVARLNKDGTLDNTFGTSGSIITDLGSGSSGTYDVALGVGWDIVDKVIFVAGSSGPSSSGGNIGLAAYDSNGTGGVGTAVVLFHPTLGGNELLLDPNDPLHLKAHRRRSDGVFRSG